MNSSDLESLLYEARPYLYAVIAFFSFYNHNISKVLIFSGMLLTLCSVSVFRMRHLYRSRKIH